MRRHRLAGLSLLLFAASCAGGQDPPEAEAADTANQPEADAPAAAGEAMSPDAHTSRNSLDWAGTYSGVLPCADCPGIETVVTLRSDGTFERSSRYIDEAATPETATGAFTWGETGNTIVLDSGGDVPEQYQVGENRLFLLDSDGERITGETAAHYELEKHISDPRIEGKAWRLVELRGSRVEPGQGAQDATLTLRAEDSVASGNASCNTFTGPYAIKNGQRIHFARNMAVTMRMCGDMSIESEFLEVLAMADNYSLSDDGMLSLNRARMAPLARFEVEGS